jgi:hypothetical protein
VGHLSTTAAFSSLYESYGNYAVIYRGFVHLGMAQSGHFVHFYAQHNFTVVILAQTEIQSFNSARI